MDTFSSVISCFIETLRLLISEKDDKCMVKDKIIIYLTKTKEYLIKKLKF